MTFVALDYTDPTLWGFIAGMGIPTMLLIVSFIVLESLRKKFRNKPLTGKQEGIYLGATFAVLVAISFGLVSLIMNHSNNVLAENQVKATQNLMQKYDIKKVDWNSSQTTANPTLRSGSSSKPKNEIVVEANNGKSYLFTYNINKETSEPTLGNMPIPAGSNQNDALNADDLLKTK